MGTAQVNEHYYLFLLDMPFYIDSLRSGKSSECITRYGRIHLFLLLGLFLVYILFFLRFLFLFFLLFTIYVKSFLLTTLMTFSLFSMTTLTNPIFSIFFQFLWCHPCRSWKARGKKTSIFIIVSGRVPCCHNFSFHFSCQPECLLQWIRFPKENFMLDVIISSPYEHINSMLLWNIFYPYIQFLEVLNVIHHWTLLFEIYQLAKQRVSFCILIMCYHFIHKNCPNDNLFMRANPSIP